MRENLPKITIITPSYNQGDFIEETILSVINQNYSNLEYIIIDGGSTDNTINIIKKYSQHISYWVSEPDKGQTHAINKGLDQATGQLISWLNSDDMLLENALYRLVDFYHENPNVSMISGKGLCLLPDLTKKEAFFEIDDKRLSRISTFAYTQPACFFSREILKKVGDLDESFEMTMDRDLFVRIALNGIVENLEEPLALFRVHEDQKTFVYSRVWDDNRKKVLSRLINTFDAQIPIIIRMKQLRCYDANECGYTTIHQFSDLDLEKIFARYLKDLSQSNYDIANMEEVYYLTSFIKKNIPSTFKSTIKKIHYRSSIFRIPYLYKVVKQLQKYI